MKKTLSLFKKRPDPSQEDKARQLILAEGIKQQSERENNKDRSTIERLEYELAVKEGVINTLKGQLAHIKMIEDKYLAMERLKEQSPLFEFNSNEDISTDSISIMPLSYLNTESTTMVVIKEDHGTDSQSVCQPAACLGIEPIYQPMLREDKLCGNCGVPSVNYRKYPDAIKAYLKDGTWHIDVLGGLICVLPNRVIDQINEYTGKQFDAE